LLATNAPAYFAPLSLGGDILTEEFSTELRPYSQILDQTKKLAREKNYNLFFPSGSDEKNKFYDIDTGLADLAAIDEDADDGGDGVESFDASRTSSW
jgi:hypothetical protein